MISRWNTVLGAATVAVALCAPAGAQQAGTYHGRKAWTLQNDQIQVIIIPGGGHIASLTLRSGPAANLNPLWLPPWPSIEPGGWAKAGGAYGDKPGAQLLSSILGHNICLDFFGAPSDAETAAGIPVHGEAPTLNWKATASSANMLSYTTTLPNAQMKVTRTLTLTPASSAVWISETVENLSNLDRPFGWNQHVTLGPPFLKEGESLYDMNGGWSMVDAKEFSKGQRLKQGGEFTWPDAPTSDGGTVSLRDWPKGNKSSDFTASLIDPASDWGWFTAINTHKNLLIGYIWPRKDWPWAANWEENKFRDGKPWNSQGVTRGIEFGTTPFAYSRKESVMMGKLHDTPVYRWISAREKQTISYAAFLAPIPAGTTGVKSVELTGDSVKITLTGVDQTLTLPLKH
ncbi:MAG TPA: hypothetical protein VKU00_33495 [Chthonomonadaceae bacterium]|nr:hypothetical protein [Chthonomonadaceae bacterium]